MASRGVVDQARSFWCPTGRLCHVGFQGCIVNKNKAFEVIEHERLAARLADLTISSDVRPLLLAGPQIFSCVTLQAGGELPTWTNVERQSLGIAAQRTNQFVECDIWLAFDLCSQTVVNASQFPMASTPLRLAME